MIAIIGDEIVDEYIEYETVRPCPEGSWPVVRESRRVIQPGGALAVANMVRALGHNTYVIGNERCGVPLTRKKRVVVDGRTLYRIDEDCTAKFSDVALQCAKELSQRDYPSVVLIADYGKGSIDRELIEWVKGWRAIVDPHGTTPPEVFYGVHGICPNRIENERYGYWEDTEHFRRCCLKLDRDGIKTRYTRGTPKHFPAECKNLVDVCGAGDQVLATIGVMISDGMGWQEACRAANVAAGIKCGRRGTVPTTMAELLDVGASSPRELGDILGVDIK